MDTEPLQLNVSRVFDAPRDLSSIEPSPSRTRAAWWGPIGNSLPRQWLPEELAGPSKQGWLQAFTKLDAMLTSDPASATGHRDGAT